MRGSFPGYVSSKLLLVDILAVLPTFVVYLALGESLWRRFYTALLLPFRFVRLYLRLSIVVRAIENAVTRQLLVVICSIACIVLAMAGWLQLFVRLIVNDDSELDSSYHNMIFHVVMIGFTISYPENGTTQFNMVVLLIVIIVVLIVPNQIADLLSKINAANKYRQRYRRNVGVRHVILAGDLNASYLEDFLTELFHPSHSEKKVHAVLVSAAEPDEDMLLMIEKPNFVRRVFYIQGTLLDDEIVKKARLEWADAVFLFAARDSDAKEHATMSGHDAQNVMRTLKIRSYPAKDYIRILVQEVLISNKARALMAGADAVMCVDEFKMNLLAQSCISPGYSTLFANLARSKPVQVKEASQKEGTFKDEYLYGQLRDVFVTKIPGKLIGKTFAEAALIVYDLFDATLLGVQLELPGGRPYIALNPGADYCLQGGEIAFVICKDLLTAQKIGLDVDYGSIIPTGTPPRPTLVGPMKAQGRITSSAVDLPSRRDALKALEEMSGHILVLSGRGLDDSFRSFLEPLRGCHLLNHRPIVVLCPEAPGDALTRRFAETPDFYVVEGSIQSREDLERVRAKDAWRVVILCSSQEDAADFKVDAEGIFTAMGFQTSEVGTGQFDDSGRVQADESDPGRLLGIPLAGSGAIPEPVKARPSASEHDPAKQVATSGDARENPDKLERSDRHPARRRRKSIPMSASDGPDTSQLGSSETYDASYSTYTASSREGEAKQEPAAPLRPAEAKIAIEKAVVGGANTLAEGAWSELFSEASQSDTQQFVMLEVRNTASMLLLPPRDAEIEDPLDSRPFAAGQAFAEPLINLIMAQTYRSELILPLLFELLSNRASSGHLYVKVDDRRVYQSIVGQVPCPKRFVGRTYAELYRHLVETFEAIPLGLYRQPLDDDTAQLPYVYATPRPTAILRPRDAVYCVLRPLHAGGRRRSGAAK